MNLINGVHYTVSAGVYSFPDVTTTDRDGGTTVKSQVGRTLKINYQYNVAAVSYSALDMAGLNLQRGTIGQPVWGYLSTNAPGQALGYSGLAYVYAPAYDLGSDASIPNHSFEVSTPWEFNPGAGIYDAEPAMVAVDLLSNPRYGAGWPVSRIGDTNPWLNYTRAQGLFLSPVLATQQPAADWLKYLLLLSNTDVTWSQGQLKFVPLGDVAVSANGSTYIPNTTPVYDLTEDHYIVTGSEDPLTVERKANDDTYNHLRLEFTNRANQYNTEPAEAKDPADIDRRGLRTKDTIEGHAVCEASVAQLLVQLMLQRELAVRATHKCIIPWTFALLEPLDLVTHTEPALGFNRLPARINKITERDDNSFELETEDCPIGMATAPIYGQQAGQGFAHDYNAAPGMVAGPVFFEAPLERATATGIEVYVAVSGIGASWGGCDVWASLDGMNYRKVGTVVGGARYGILNAPIGTTDTSISVGLAGRGGQINPGTPSDAAQNNTLCWLDGSNGGEYFNYVGAALTAPYTYTLSGLVRPAFRNPVQAHAAPSLFARVDQAIVSSGPLERSLIGSTIKFKFTSFNVFGGAPQSIADVPVYEYTITGAALRSPLANVQNLVSVYRAGQTLLAWDAVTDPVRTISYEIRKGAAWQSAQVLGRQAATEFVADGDGTYWVSAFSDPAYSSAPTTLVIAGATLVKNVLQTWDEQATGWSGTVDSGAIVDGSAVELVGAGLFSAIPSLFSAVPTVAYYGGVAASGSYTIPTAHEVDVGTEQPCNISCNYVMHGDNPFALFSAIPLVSALASVAGDYAASVGLKIQIATAPLSGTYGAWSDFVPGTFVARKFKLRAVLLSYDASVRAVLDQFAFTVDMPDRSERGTSVAVPSGGTTVTFARPFQITPNTQITVVNASAGDDVLLTAQSANGFTVQVLNGGVGVARTINWISQAY